MSSRRERPPRDIGSGYFRQTLADAAMRLELLRSSLERNAGDILNWKNIKSHVQRLRAAQPLGSVDWLTVSGLVVCKRDVTGDGYLPYSRARNRAMQHGYS